MIFPSNMEINQKVYYVSLCKYEASVCLVSPTEAAHVGKLPGHRLMVCEGLSHHFCLLSSDTGANLGHLG